MRLPSTSIDLEVEARRQGSTYVLDDSSTSESAGGIPAARSPRLVQLDGFHEATHPYYWSPHTVLEAEMFSGFLRGGELDPAVGTERQGLATGNQYAFLGFTSFVRLSCEPSAVRKRVFEYQFEPAADRAAAPAAAASSEFAASFAAPATAYADEATAFPADEAAAPALAAVPDARSDSSGIVLKNNVFIGTILSSLLIWKIKSRF